MEEDGQQDGEKTEDPSEQRIQDFREKGQVALSKELNSVFILTAAFLTLLISTFFLIEEISAFFQYILQLDPNKAFTAKMGPKILKRTVLTMLKCIAPVAVSVFCIGIVSSVSQIGFVFSPKVLSFDLNKINPVNGFKRIFSMKSIVEGIKGFLKFILIISVTYMAVKDRIPEFTGFMHSEIEPSLLFGRDIMFHLSFVIILSMTIVALIDFAWEKYSYWQKLKMTKDQSRRESKEREGDPLIKQRIRSIQREMAQKRMLEDVKDADAIITNPTHFSIAIKYDLSSMVAPKVIGKGQDFLALRIREVAKANNVPLVENVYLARTLYKTVKVGEYVPRSLYKAVAEVLAFVYRLRRKKTSWGNLANEKR